MMNDLDWMNEARCAGKEHRWFFSTGYDGRALPQALELCEGCPVRSDCLDHALELNIRDGVWGGLTGDQRKRLVRERR